MNSRVARSVLVLICACLLSRDLLAQRSGAAEVLTNESIVSMTAAKLNRDLILAKVNTTKNTFDVSVNGLVSLTQGKVHQDVIKSMISAYANPKLGPAKNTEVLDNQAVVSMILGKVAKAVVLAKIQGTRANFDVSAAGLVSLSQAKVPQDVIQAMVAKANSGF
jgi:hypothetical protein